MSNSDIKLVGNIGRKSELKTSKAGKPYYNTSLAVWQNKEKTDWFSLTAFGEVAERLSKMEKGTKIVAMGRLVLDEWEKDGVKKFGASCLLDDFSEMMKKPVDESTPF